MVMYTYVNKLEEKKRLEAGDGKDENERKDYIKRMGRKNVIF